MASKAQILIFFSFICLNIYVHGKTKLVSLNEENWDKMLNGEWMVEL